MDQNIVDSRVFRLSKLSILLSALICSPLYAADENSAKNKEIKSTKVVVTGSRIQSVNSLAPSPVTSISGEELELTGHVNVMDALMDLPSIAGGLTNETGHFNYANTGMNTVNLRNLGHERTLILINGRRVVSSDVGELLSDMNAIPTSLIHRIDITTGGGSATYGSGAIAGVVNFILKDDFEGFESEIRRNQSGKSDNQSDLLRFTLGGNFSENKGNAVLNIEKSDSEGLASRDRGVTGVRFDTDKNVLNPPQLSSYAPHWRYDIGNFQTGWRDGQLVDWSLENDGYRHADTRTISTPIKRLIINATSHYYLQDNIRAFAEFSYAKTNTENPSDLYWTGSLTSRGAPISIDNPFVPQALRNIALANNVTEIHYRGRINEYGPTGFEAERIVTRFVAGVDGTIADDWDWEISYNYGEVSNDQEGKDVHSLAFKKATDVILDPVTNEPRCRDQAFVDIGCVPTNVFAPFTDEATRFWSNKTTLDGKLEQEVMTASFSNNNLFDLPAGSVAIAAGIEHRREYSEEHPDSTTLSGMSGGIQIDGLKGEYEVDEYFVEVDIPILSDVYLAKSLGLNFSGRGSDYSHTGRNDSWQVGTRWQINDEILFRAQYSEAFRAPTIADMFNGSTRQVLSLANIDPCHNITETTAGAGVTPQQAEACRLIPGVAAAIANGGTFNGEPENDDVERYSYFGPSPDLKVENAQTQTIGFIYSPNYIENFSVAMDYYSISIDNIITGVGQRYKNERCLEGLNEFCRAVERDSETGVIHTMYNYVFNLSGREVQGIDLELNYKYDLIDYGSLGFKLLYSRVDQHKTKAQPEAEWINELDQLPYFKQRANFSTTYKYQDLTLNWSMVYQGSIFDNKIANYYNNHVDAQLLHNVQARYNFGEDSRHQVYLGVDNLFDQDPPFLPEGYANGIPQSATAAPYSRIGRMWYLGSKFSF
ncbi:TonB-dependent receptor domain-containing protein [Aliikangiella sp. IMCC44359]|uniref:TonB-dependent receptor domain-containing protein n=1 Tax=Aliikangiella sp. IMCC44359 TaxID=3459125 RepID=UPI00403A8928